jgi:dolichol-phosphate mannosyltransferase
MGDFKISIVIPAYNEVTNIPVLCRRVAEAMTEYDNYEILFVDDGSTDGSLAVLKRLAAHNPKIRYLSFSKNFGHQMALRAGINHAVGDCIITMDADLQHPPEMLPCLVEKWLEGFEVVYTVREPNRSQPYLKRLTSDWFYRVLQYLTEVDIEKGAADFRLIDSRVADYLRQFRENDLFLRGIIAWLGFSQAKISYHPALRHSGQTKYSFKKMLLLASAGLTSFTTKPLYLSVLLGFAISSFSVVYGLYALFHHFVRNDVVSGWTSLILTILLIGGIQLIVMGIIGIYLGKVFREVKQRPSYIVRESNVKRTSSHEFVPSYPAHL